MTQCATTLREFEISNLRFQMKLQICAEEALAQEYDTYGCST